jgi:hypothetical protein
MIATYKIICSKCHQAFSPEAEDAEALPADCPHCHQPLGDDYEIQYETSTKTKPFRIVAMIILVAFAILVLLGIAAALLSFLFRH